jgi:hypothetical protein
MAALTAALTSMPAEDAPVAAWRSELMSMDDVEDEDEERSELSAETELIKFA